MRWDNAILVVICSAAIASAGTIAWRGRRLPIVAPAIEIHSARASVLDALRSVVCVFSAAFVAGLLVVGLGGRLVMRILAATSGDSAQGLLTDAQETVGEITLGGTVGFVVFAGVALPLLSSFIYLALRQLLPNRSWIAGVVFGALLLGTIGVRDPLSPQNVDFAILTPRWLAVALIAATALLFGMTFTALAARLDMQVPVLSDRASDASFRGKLAYSSMFLLVIPVFLVPTIFYVGARTLSRGRLGALLVRPPIRTAGHAAVAILIVVAIGLVVNAAADIA